MKVLNRGFLYLLVPMIFFSSFEVVSRTIGGAIQPTQLTFIRFLIGGAILLPFALQDLKKRSIHLSTREVLWLFFLGFLNVGVSMNLSQYAILKTNASISAVLFSSNPLYVAVFSSIILKERLTVKKGIGLLIGLVGVVFAFLHGTASGADFYTGVVLMLCAAVIYGMYTVLAKKITIKIGSLSMTSLSFLFGCITMIPWFFALRITPFSFDFSKVWWQVLYLSILVTGLAQFVFYKALCMVDTSLGSMTFFVKPLLASIMAACFLHEHISLNLIIGIVLVIVGITIVKRSVETPAPISAAQLPTNAESNQEG